MFIKRFVTLFVSVFIVGSANAAGLDCEKSLTETESMICEDGGLSNLDSILARTYKAVLDISSNMRQVKDDQRKWLKRIRDKCVDETCLDTVYTRRIEALESQWIKLRSELISSTRAESNRVNPFEGKWSSCSLWQGEVICSSFVLAQQGNRVCGDWDYWATNRTYKGQLQANVKSLNEAEIALECGDIGGSIQVECNNKVKPNGRWGKSKGVLKICDGRLYQGTKGCGDVELSDSFIYEPLPNKNTYIKQPWINSCLAN